MTNTLLNHFKRVLILVDSVGKYLTGNRDAEILPYIGETTGEFIHKIRYHIIKLNRYTHVIVHVGTNNVLNNKPWGNLEFVQDFNSLNKTKVQEHYYRYIKYITQTQGLFFLWH